VACYSWIIGGPNNGWAPLAKYWGPGPPGPPGLTPMPPLTTEGTSRVLYPRSDRAMTAFIQQGLTDGDFIITVWHYNYHRRYKLKMSYRSARSIFVPQSQKSGASRWLVEYAYQWLTMTYAAFTPAQLVNGALRPRHTKHPVTMVVS